MSEMSTILLQPRKRILLPRGLFLPRLLRRGMRRFLFFSFSVSRGRGGGGSGGKSLRGRNPGAHSAFRRT